VRYRITGRLIVRRVLDANTQDPLFPVWRYHPFFTNTTEPTTDADITHRGHAICETVWSDLINGPCAHQPSGSSGHDSPYNRTDKLVVVATYVGCWMAAGPPARGGAAPRQRVRVRSSAGLRVQAGQRAFPRTGSIPILVIVDVTPIGSAGGEVRDGGEPLLPG